MTRAALALLACGVVACADTGVRPTAESALADSADQKLIGMSTSVTTNSMRRSLIDAETAYVYMSRNLTDLRRFRMRFFDAQGVQTSTLTADRGLYNSMTSRLDARGHVVVTNRDGGRLVTTHLVYDKQANQIVVDTVFTYDSPTEHGAGNGFTSDVEFKNTHVQQPRGFQRGRGFLLPGQ